MIDLSTYTETDPDSKLTVSSSTVTATDIYQNAGSTTRVSKDYGSSYFDGLNHNFTAHQTAVDVGSGGFSFVSCSATDFTDGFHGLGVNDVSVGVNDDGGAVNSRIYLMRGNFASFDGYSNSVWGVSNPYYLNLFRFGGTQFVDLYIYSDSGRTTLIDILSINGLTESTTWRWHHAFNHTNQGVNKKDSLYYENFEFFPIGQRMAKTDYLRRSLFGPKVF